MQILARGFEGAGSEGVGCGLRDGGLVNVFGMVRLWSGRFLGWGRVSLIWIGLNFVFFLRSYFCGKRWDGASFGLSGC